MLSSQYNCPDHEKGRLVQNPDVFNDLNPKYQEVQNSKDVYQYAQTIGQVFPGQTVDFLFPGVENLNLDGSYVQLNANTINAVASTAEVYTFQLLTPTAVAGTSTSASGTFRLMIGNEITAPLPFNATNTQILTAIYNMQGFPANIQLVTNPAVSPQPLSDFTILTNTLSTAGPGVLSFSINYPSLKLYLNGVPIIFLSSLLNAAGLPLIALDLSAPNGVYKWPQLDQSGIWSIVKMVNVTFNGESAINIDDYNRFASIYARMNCVEFDDTEGELLFGKAQEQFADIDYQQKYQLPLYGCGLLSKNIPLALIPGAVFKISLILDQQNNYLVYDNTISPLPSVQFTNFRYYYTRENYSEKTTQDYINAMRGGWRLYFRNYLTFRNQITSAQPSLIVTPNVSRLTGVWTVMQQIAFQINTFNQFRTSSFPNFNLQQARLSLNSEYLPYDFLTSAKNATNPNGEYTEFLIETLNAMSMWSTTKHYPGLINSELFSRISYYAPNHTYVNYPKYTKAVPPSFVIGIATNPDIQDRATDDGIIERGLFVKGINNISVELENINYTTPMIAYSWCEFVGCMIFKDGAINYEK